MSFPEKSTCKDLSDLPENKRFPTYGASMAGGNATSEVPVMGAPGTESEGYALVWDTAHHDFGDPTHPADLPGPATSEGELSTDEKGSGHSPAAPAWKEL
jgi:hypothetical protein